MAAAAASCGAASWVSTTPCAAFSRITSDAQAQPTEDALRAIAANAPGVTLFVPRPLFCDETACHPRKDDVPLYFDGDHLNVEGSLFLAPAWRSALEKAAAAVSRPGS